MRQRFLSIQNTHRAIQAPAFLHRNTCCTTHSSSCSSFSIHHDLLLTSQRTFAYGSNQSCIQHNILSLQAMKPMNVQSTSRLYCTAEGSLKIVVPPIAESVSSGKLKEWLVKVGDVVEEDAELCQIESDKLEIPVRAPCAGTIVALLAQEGDVVDVGKHIVTFTKGTFEGKVKTSAIPSPAEATKAQVTQSTPVIPTPVSKTTTTVSTSSTTSNEDKTRRVRNSSMRLRIADRLKASQNTAAMLTTFNEIDMNNLIQLREKHKDAFFKKHGVKLGFMSAFAKASASALTDIPIINASWEDEYVVYHDYVDISIAVATPTGLVVPVLRNVGEMNFADIEKKINEYGLKAKNRTLSLAEMTGGTFTISNGGVFGSWMGTPIINPPQSAILGMHATKPKPWIAKDNKTIVIRPIMAVALTYDHRLIDGRDAVMFLVKIKNIIEDPARLLLDV